MVAHVNYAKKKTSSKEQRFWSLVLGFFKPFNKIEFSIDRSFQNYFIFVKGVWENSENSTLILASFTKFLFVLNR